AWCHHLRPTSQDACRCNLLGTRSCALLSGDKRNGGYRQCDNRRNLTRKMNHVHPHSCLHSTQTRTTSNGRSSHRLSLVLPMTRTNLPSSIVSVSPLTLAASPGPMRTTIGGSGLGFRM